MICNEGNCYGAEEDCGTCRGGNDFSGGDFNTDEISDNIIVIISDSISNISNDNSNCDKGIAIEILIEAVII